MNPDLKYANKKYSLYKLQELESQIKTAYSSGLLQSNAVLCLPIIPIILLFCYHDNALHVAPTIANLLTHMKTARVSLDIEVNVTDYSDTSLNQDTDNDIITLRQHGPTQRIIDTLYLDNNATSFTSTYPFLHPTNNTTSQAFQNYVSSRKLSSYIHYCQCSNNVHDIHGNKSDHTRSKLAYPIF